MLERGLRPEVRTRARTVAPTVCRDGARIAAERLMRASEEAPDTDPQGT